MNLVQALALGIVQGLTEFLPVSSSGHLVIGQRLFNFSQPPVLFDILVHLGTLLAVVFYFKEQFLKLSFKTIKLILIGTIPAVLGGLFLNQYIKVIFSSLVAVGVSLLITAILLFSTRLVKKKNKTLKQLNWQDALIIGVFQALAIIPGISRSGSTVVAGLWRGTKRKTAFNFSFFLALPAILGALTLQIPEMLKDGDQVGIGLVGLIIAAITGFLALKILERVVLKGKLHYFAIYCLILGLITLYFSG